jgi:hypothetical protein
MPILKILLALIGVSPTLLVLLYAGMMIGKPKLCTAQAPCQSPVYGAEVLLMPLMTGGPLVIGYVLGVMPSRKNRKLSPKSEVKLADGVEA